MKDAAIGIASSIGDRHYIGYFQSTLYNSENDVFDFNNILHIKSSSVYELLCVLYLLKFVLVREIKSSNLVPSVFFSKMYKHLIYNKDMNTSTKIRQQILMSSFCQDINSWITWYGVISNPHNFLYRNVQQLQTQ